MRKEGQREMSVEPERGSEVFIEVPSYLSDYSLIYFISWFFCPAGKLTCDRIGCIAEVRLWEPCGLSGALAFGLAG